MNEVYAFEVNVKDRPWQSVINARNAGKAKYLYLLDVRESWPDITFADLTCRKLHPHAVSSEQFIRTAIYRGHPDARCGQRVKVGASRGVIVGSNSSANFNVLFDEDDPKYPGLTLNVHPHGITFEVEKSADAGACESADQSAG